MAMIAFGECSPRRDLNQDNIHRGDAETLRNTKSKATPESAEVAEDAEGNRPGFS
jgi:hypothetical protein